MGTGLLQDNERRTDKGVSPADLREITGINEAEEQAMEKRAAASDDQPGKIRSAGKKLLGRYSGLSRTRKTAITAGVIGTIITAMFAGGGFLGFMNAFKLDSLMNNIEKRAFIRYQVDMNGRSSKWINAYIRVRLSEVDDPSKAVGERDNLLFRSNRVDNNQFFTDWYRTMRASNFEQELYDKQGIKFTSVAYQDGNRVRFRTGMMTVKRDNIMFPMTAADQAALDSGDTNGFNGRLREFVEVKSYDTSKEARQAIKQAVNANTRWYEVQKRLYLRRSIQNMTGTRSWRFFEKTREKASDKTIDLRNKIIVKSLPEGSKSGRIIQCLFGIPDQCKSRSTDPNDPDNRAGTVGAGAVSCSTDSSNAACDTGIDEDNAPEDAEAVRNGGEADSGLTEGVAGLSESERATAKMISTVVGKVSGPLAAVSILDSLNNVNTMVKDKVLSNLVYSARSAQAIGLFTTYNIAKDQVRSGEVSSKEVNMMMSTLDGVNTSEGWQRVVEAKSDSNTASAASFSPAADKEAYCSDEHQAAIELPENQKAANSEVSYYCDSEKIGDANLANMIERGWDQSIGGALQPVFSIYNGSGASKVVGSVLGVFDGAVGAIARPIIKAVGLQDNIEAVAAWAATKAASILGAGPALTENAPSGKITNHVLAGAAASAEAQSRFLGAARTTDATRERVTEDVALYEDDERSTTSIWDRYASLSNSQSFASTVILKATSKGFASSLFRMPSFTFGKAGATQAYAETSYSAANFAGVKTYDFPEECIGDDPLAGTPQNRTNADDLGLISPDELTWELVQDSDKFYAKLYADNPDASDTIETVYNCAAFDSAVTGSLGSLYNDDLAGPNAIDTQNPDEAGENTGSGASLTIGSFNILGADHTKGSSYIGRAEKATTAIQNNGLDIVGVQEFQGLQHSKFKQILGPSWQFFPNDNKNQNAIIWNSEKFTLKNKGIIPDQHYFGGSKLSTPYVVLAAKEGGQRIIVLNTHDPVSNKKHGDNTIWRYRNSIGQINLVKRLRTDNPDIPVFVTGDFNAGLTGAGKAPNANGYPYQGNNNNLAYCMLMGVGGDNASRWGGVTPLNNAYDLSRGRDKKCPNPLAADDKQEFRGAIDHVFMTDDVTMDGKESYIALPPKEVGSDHPFVIAKVTVPGITAESDSGGTTQGGWGWPVERKNFPSKGVTNCFRKPGPGRSGHTGIDISVPSGTPVLAAKAGKVVDARSMGDGGNAVIIDHGGGIFTNYQHNSSFKVKKGDDVKAGQVIALSGSTGFSTGPHIHFSVTTEGRLDSRHTVSFSNDPLKYLPKGWKTACN